MTVSQTSLADVSRETLDRLKLLESELLRWQAIKNLVGPGTLDDIWTRHIVDSLQLLAAAPGAKTWLDLGSGAGFPGLVIAIAGQERGLSVDLVESNSRKCAFLRHVSRLTGANAKIHEARLEAVIPQFVGRAQVVSARALAPLTKLLEWTEPLLKTGTTGLFPKGRDVDAELTEAARSWKFNAEILPSQTDSDARILRITSIERMS
ncbi:16S rRNA (guanine(527)-N(7))-methyltransferase RsmG [Microvirga brassicacearum]|uniref:Ribosomal RNA small subunit methyltransferase G n=1 Tax=Microvirga brassicacearum TaxID=2580413 RepID=A0A5N3PE50_9HYPH|nr:16S rRNA (guanine(527)-N(7))-methyltransferase RsmG [Microvirga brassicacearum]KAB0267983.1 16S rRNA (guanine(527)-N(7))-methyltransferase RsmG [Microvirga brassicacearum]